MIKLRFVLGLILLAPVFSFAEAPLYTRLFGQPATPSIREKADTLTGTTGIEFQEGLIHIPDTSRWAHNHLVSVALRAPLAPDEPIFILEHGMTQDKISFAELIANLYKLNPNIGVVAVDQIGSGETLERNLPLNYDIPIEQDAIALSFITRSLREQYPHNPIIPVGVSGGAAVIFKALEMNPQFRKDYTRVVAAAFCDRVDGVEEEVGTHTYFRKMFWPIPGANFQFLKNSVRRDILFSRAYLAEPILLRSLFPTTAEAFIRKTIGLDNLDMENISRNVRDSSLHVMVGSEDQYMTFMKVIDFYHSWAATQSVLVLDKSEHKLNESNPEYMAAWLLRLAQPKDEPQGIFLGDPAAGTASSLNADGNKIQLPVSHTGVPTAQVWKHNLLRAMRSWRPSPVMMQNYSWSVVNVWYSLVHDMMMTSYADLRRSLLSSDPVSESVDRIATMRGFLDSLSEMQQNLFLKSISSMYDTMMGPNLQGAGAFKLVAPACKDALFTIVKAGTSTTSTSSIR